jgi:hypothetical protein
MTYAKAAPKMIYQRISPSQRRVYTDHNMALEKPSLALCSGHKKADDPLWTDKNSISTSFTHDSDTSAVPFPVRAQIQAT